MSSENRFHPRALLFVALVLPLAGLLMCCTQSRNVVEPVPPANQPSLTLRADGQPRPEPLYILDGVEQTQGSLRSKLDPNTIQSISVLKDAAATAKYGEKGKNGVILITSKTK